MRRAVLFTALVFVISCEPARQSQQAMKSPAPPPAPSAALPTARTSGAEEVASVTRAFGAKLRLVSLLAPRPLVEQSMRQEYAAFVTPALLQQWIGDPTSAPGRRVSSPWPDHIDIVDVRSATRDRYVVDAAVVEVTSDGPAGERRVPVRITVERVNDAWRIAGWQTLDDTESAADVIRSYYGAINRRDYAGAYRYWSGEGSASNQPYSEFAKGFADTASVDVVVGTPGRVGAAAGSRYIDIPVVVTARNTDGEVERFRGKYTLRRSVVDGAKAEQRQWRIFSATLHRTGAKTSSKRVVLERHAAAHPLERIARCPRRCAPPLRTDRYSPRPAA